MGKPEVSIMEVAKASYVMEESLKMWFEHLPIQKKVECFVLLEDDEDDDS